MDLLGTKIGSTIRDKIYTNVINSNTSNYDNDIYFVILQMVEHIDKMTVELNKIIMEQKVKKINKN